MKVAGDDQKDVRIALTFLVKIQHKKENLEKSVILFFKEPTYRKRFNIILSEVKNLKIYI